MNVCCKALLLGSFLFLGACATIIKSDKIPVHFLGGTDQGVTHFALPDGEFTTKSGDRTVMVSRSKEDIPISVTCNDQTRQGYIQTKYDPVAGVLGNIVFGGLIGMTIDAYNDKAYDPPDTFNLKPLCSAAPEVPVPVAENAPINKSPRSPAAQPGF